MVASSRMVEVSRKRRVLTERCRSMPRRISVSMSVVSVAAGESVPRPTRRPARRNSSRGATPMPSWELARGHTHTDTLCSRSLRTSSSVTWTAWTTMTLGASKAPQLSA